MSPWEAKADVVSQTDRGKPTERSKEHGPALTHGRLRSRANAWHYGLAAETVITPLENADEYRAFEGAIVADYRPRSGVENALVHRLASLLWRLRRNIAIETGLFEAQGRIIRSRRFATQVGAGNDLSGTALGVWVPSNDAPLSPDKGEPQAEGLGGRENPSLSTRQLSSECYFRLTKENREILERLDRRDANLWRQAAQTVMILNVCKK